MFESWESGYDAGQRKEKTEIKAKIPGIAKRINEAGDCTTYPLFENCPDLISCEKCLELWITKELGLE